VDSAKLNDWMQVAGIFALVASLVFVGLQMKQSQEIAIAAQYQERANTANDAILAMMTTTSGERGSQVVALARHQQWSKELIQRLAAMDPVEIERMSMRFAALMTLYDNNFFSMSLGFWTRIHG
jgi:kynurenine formamidase